MADANKLLEGCLKYRDGKKVRTGLFSHLGFNFKEFNSLKLRVVYLLCSVAVSSVVPGDYRCNFPALT